MFEVAETFIIQFINFLPALIPLILVLNLCAKLLFE